MMRPVWVIDDDRSIRWVFEKALAREGIPFKTFAQATEAMEALDAAGAPQVLVSDIRMPGTSGLDRKSTRLNSSHDQISYAVFCLKKKIVQRTFASLEGDP